jgi:hypothetical protein
MENGQPNLEAARTDNLRLEKMVAEYERAQAVGHHTDTVIHEITAIVWGGQTPSCLGSFWKSIVIRTTRS